MKHGLLNFAWIVIVGSSSFAQIPEDDCKTHQEKHETHHTAVVAYVYKKDEQLHPLWRCTSGKVPDLGFLPETRTISPMQNGSVIVCETPQNHYFDARVRERLKPGETFVKLELNKRYHQFYKKREISDQECKALVSQAEGRPQSASPIASQTCIPPAPEVNHIASLLERHLKPVITRTPKPSLDKPQLTSKSRQTPSIKIKQIKFIPGDLPKTHTFIILDTSGSFADYTNAAYEEIVSLRKKLRPTDQLVVIPMLNSQDRVKQKIVQLAPKQGKAVRP